MLPFDWKLWIAVLVTVFVSALGDWLLERQSSGTLTASIYESFAGVFWGGFDTPRTRLSAVYQIFLAFCVLVLISSYSKSTALRT